MIVLGLLLRMKANSINGVWSELHEASRRCEDATVTLELLVKDHDIRTGFVWDMLVIEAFNPGTYSKQELENMLREELCLHQTKFVVAKVEFNNDLSNNPEVYRVVLDCPIPAGFSENELGQDCDGCAAENPLRADLCRKIWPHHWEGTLLEIDPAEWTGA